MEKIKKLIVTFVVLSITACGSSGRNRGKDPLLDKKVNIIKADKNNIDKPVAQIVEISKLRAEYGNRVDPYIEEILESIYSNYKIFFLDSFKKSPNKTLKIPSNITQIHLKNNYPSGNVLFFMMQDGNTVVRHIFEFNSAKKFEVAPGKYDIFFIIDRKFNENVYTFKLTKNLSGGDLYTGEFTITSKYRGPGKCKDNFIVDDDMCIKPLFTILDNCEKGSHLVEYLCCKKGFNFIVNGKCSKYSDKPGATVCPPGYQEAGKGRCCPKGYSFITGKCRKNKEE